MKEIKILIMYVLLSVLFSISLQAQKVDLYEGLISNYDFKGNVDDKSGNGNHGVLYGPVLSQDRFGSSDNAYFFDGVNDYILVSPVTDVSNIGDFSIAVWVNCYGWELQPDVIPNIIDQQYIFDGHGYSSIEQNDFLREGFTILYVFKPDEQQFIYNTTFYSTSNYYSNQLNINFELLNSWHHIVFIRKGSETNHYIDGILVSVKELSSDGLNMDHNWFIGTFSGNNPYYNMLNYNFYGLIDDIYIYDRAINACEVEALYSGDFPPER